MIFYLLACSHIWAGGGREGFGEVRRRAHQGTRSGTMERWCLAVRSSTTGASFISRSGVCAVELVLLPLCRFIVWFFPSHKIYVL